MMCAEEKAELGDLVPLKGIIPQPRPAHDACLRCPRGGLVWVHPPPGVAANFIPDTEPKIALHTDNDPVGAPSSSHADARCSRSAPPSREPTSRPTRGSPSRLLIVRHLDKIGVRVTKVDGLDTAYRPGPGNGSLH